jgi:hypothetical protein
LNGTSAAVSTAASRARKGAKSPRTKRARACGERTHADPQGVFGDGVGPEAVASRHLGDAIDPRQPRPYGPTGSGFGALRLAPRAQHPIVFATAETILR